MKVLFDFYEIAISKGKSIGIYNYALLLLKNLSENRELNLVVTCSGENYNEISEIQNITIKKISNDYPTFKERLIWRMFTALRIAKAEQCDVYFSPKGFSPGFFKRRERPFIVVTVHDMIPFYYAEEYPDYFGAFENFIITKTLLQSIRTANKIITVSKFSRDMILNYVNKGTDVEVVYNGISLPLEREKVAQKNPYIFAITSDLPHKNKDHIISGYLEYRKLTANPLPLKICGISECNIELSEEQQASIEFIRFADETVFTSLFSNASLFLFLPRIEGFGFPPLEGLNYKVPCIVSDIPVLREILGQAGYFVDHEDSSAIANGISLVLSDNILQKRIVQDGAKILPKFNIENCGKETLSVFSRLLS